MKVSFTNQLRMIAERHPGTDIHAILDAIGSDSRIGKKYLRAGLSYGGPCFPRDNRLLAYTARQAGLEAPLAEASDRVNQRTNEDLFETVRGLAKTGDVVAVLGVTYKPDTYITEEAAGLFLAQQLRRHGYRVLVHDFAANPANAPALHEFECLSSLAELKRRNEVKLAVICCPWPEYQGLALGPTTQIFTPWRL
jgi:UDPglucose 6-dehydrogenase